MAIFNGHVITNAGRNLLGRALAGEGKVILTRAAMGDGKTSQDIRELTGLISEKITANIADKFNDRGTVNLKVQITNSQLEEAFKTEEFGIFAKIEGDREEILYSYCNAIEADTIPSNSLGDIFVEEHTVYIAFSSDAEVDIYIKEGAVFLTLETANKNYVQTGLLVEGKLSNGRTSLVENGQYQADDGKWYHNIGGNRAWKSGTGEPDEQLVEITYFKLYSEIIKKQSETDKRLLTKAKRIWEAINELFNDKQNKTDNNLLTTVKTIVGAINELFSNKLEKGGYGGNAKNLNDEISKKASPAQLGRVLVGKGLTSDGNGRLSVEETPSRRPVSDAEKTAWNGKLTQGTVPNSLNSAEKIVAALQGNGGLKFDENLLYIEDKGIKKKGFYYLSRLMSGIFECLEQTEETVNNSAKFKDISNKSNSDRLDNLFDVEVKENQYGTSYKYPSGLLVFKPNVTGEIIEGTYPIPFTEVFYAGGTYAANATVLDEATYQYNAWRSNSYTNRNEFKLFGTSLFGTTIDWNRNSNVLNLVVIIGRW